MTHPAERKDFYDYIKTLPEDKYKYVNGEFVKY